MAKLNYKDVQISFLQNGVDGVREAIADYTRNPKNLLDKALKSLTEADYQSEELEALEAFRNTFVSNQTRGKSPLAFGETRTYSVQEIIQREKETKRVVSTSLFLRIPVESLNVCKGDFLNATLGKDENGVPFIKIQ